MKKEEVIKIIENLKKEYPDAKCSLDFNTPFQMMVAVVLSAQCTDARVNIVTKELFKKYEKRDPEEIVGEDIIIPCRFTSQKEYVTKILTSQINKRLGTDKNYAKKEDLPSDWVSYDIQRKQKIIQFLLAKCKMFFQLWKS